MNYIFTAWFGLNLQEYIYIYMSYIYGDHIFMYISGG